MRTLTASGRRSHRRLPLLCGLLGLVSIGWAIPIRPGLVVGGSMAPAFQDGQLFLMRPHRGEMKLGRGDVVIVRVGGETYIKRVRALPGETVWGLACDEVPGRPAYVARSKAEVKRLERAVELSPATGRVVQVRVPSESVFLVGDAENASYDSRHFGPVPLEAIKGLVVAPTRARYSRESERSRGHRRPGP